MKDVDSGHWLTLYKTQTVLCQSCNSALDRAAVIRTKLNLIL